MLQFSQHGVTYFQFESLPADGRIRHAVFSRKGGVSPAPFADLNLSVSVADDERNVFDNRQQAYGLFQRRNETIVHAHLVHGNKVATVTQAQNGENVTHIDGLITNEPGCALTMNYADCTPVFLYDPVQAAIGLGHAGWKGCVADLPGAMVRAMQASFSSEPADIIAGIGPSICFDHYEVDEPLVSEVKTAFDDWSRFLVRPGNGRYHFDLPAANACRLSQAGVQQIEMSGFCTAERTDLFFSHRAEKGKTGRFGTLFILENEQP